MKKSTEGLDTLQGDNATFYGQLLPELFAIKKNLMALKRTPLKNCGPLVLTITESLDKRFRNFFNLTEIDAVVAAVSHPFFKLIWVPKDHKDAVKKVFIETVKKTASSMKKNSQDSDRTQEKASNHTKYKFDDDDDSSQDSTSSKDQVELEILQYLKDSATELDMLHRYPTVKEAFKAFNTTLPSSAPVERLFSYGGMVGRPHRRNLTDEMFEKILMAKANKDFN